MPETTIVIPCYNEADRLDRQAFVDFADSAKGVSLLFVDDGSTDSTVDVLTELIAGREQVFALKRMDRNVGKAEAVRTGLLQASRTDCRFVGFWDADLATPLDAIFQFEEILQRRDKIDVVIGSRMKLMGRDIERHPLRSLCGRVFASTASLVLGFRVFDTQCGAKMFRVNDRFRTSIEQPFSSRWIFDVELFARLCCLLQPTELSSGDIRRTVYELPLDVWRDVDGSKLRGRDFARAIAELAGIGLRYRVRGNWRPQESPATRVGEDVAKPNLVTALDDLNSLEPERTTGSAIRPIQTEHEDPHPIRPRRAA